MTWRLEVGGSDISGATLPDVSAARGMDVSRGGVSPRAGELQAVLDQDRARLGDQLALRTAGGAHVWGGRVYALDQTTDDTLNALRYSLAGVGIIAQIVDTGSGFTTNLHTDITIDQAINALLDAIGIPSARRDIGASPRRLTLWWLAASDDPWNTLLRLVRTAGPRARLYEDTSGRIAFRDTALAATSAYTVRGRDGPVGTGAIVSRLDSRDAPVDRVVNEARVTYSDVSSVSPTFIAAFGEMNVATPQSNASMIVTIEDMQDEGIGADDLVVATMDWYFAGGPGALDAYPSGLTWLTPQDPFFATGWRRGPGDIRLSVTGGGGSVATASLAVVAFRGAGDPVNYKKRGSSQAGGRWSVSVARSCG